MAVTSGFFNAKNGDRKYEAGQLSSIFDGLIIDGIFGSIGTCFVVKADTGLTVNVGIGKAWFHHTWTLNDAILPLEAPPAEVLLNRIDALVIEVNTTESVRENTIKFVLGTPASVAVRPTLEKTKYVHQYPLCYINRAAASTEIRQADITNMVGTTETPLVAGILETIDLDILLPQWRDELDRFVETEEADFTEWFNQMKADLTAEKEFLDQWIDSEQADFITWFNQMKDQLSTDAAGRLQLEIDREEINRILIVGFVDGTKEFSADGTVITAIAADGRTLVKTFTDNFLTITSVLNSANGIEIARSVKRFNAEGTLIETTVTYT